MRKLTMILSALTLFAVSTSATAAVRHTLEANACYVWQGASSMTWGYFFNNSTSTETGMDCLVIKEGSSIASAWVKVRDQNPNTNVQCTLNHVVQTSSAVYYVNNPETKSTSGYSSDWQVLTFGAQSNVEGYGFYHMSCVIPVSSGGLASAVGAYSVLEN